MGILNKLKNVLFEEEEIEIPEAEMKEEKVVHKPDREIKKRDAVKMTFDGEEEDILSDRELFKAEPTFNFPLFDEQEFESIKKEEPVVSNPKVYEKQKEVNITTISSKNLASNLTANIIGTNSIGVIVKGVQSVIDNVSANNINAYIDLEGYTAGEYDVQVKIENDDPKINYVVSSTVKVRIQ